MASEEGASAGTVAESGNEAPMQPPSYGIAALTSTDVACTLMGPEFKNGSVHSRQIAQMKEQGNTPTGRAEPLSSLENTVSGKDGERGAKASCESKDSRSTQEGHPRKVLMLGGPYGHNHLRGTTIFIRRYDAGWLIYCDSRVSYVDSHGFFRIDMDNQLKCTLAAFLSHVTVTCGLMSVTKVFQSNVRAYICENEAQDFKRIWAGVQDRIKEALKRRFPTVNTERQSGVLLLVDRTNSDDILLIKARREAGDLDFILQAGTVKEWSDGSGYACIRPIKMWPKDFPDLETASELLWEMISSASLLDRCTGGFGSCFFGGKDQEWSSYSCRELPDNPELYRPGDDIPAILLTPAILNAQCQVRREGGGIVSDPVSGARKTLERKGEDPRSLLPDISSDLFDLAFISSCHEIQPQPLPETAGRRGINKSEHEQPSFGEKDVMN